MCTVDYIIYGVNGLTIALLLFNLYGFLKVRRVQNRIEERQTYITRVLGNCTPLREVAAAASWRDLHPAALMVFRNTLQEIVDEIDMEGMDRRNLN